MFKLEKELRPIVTDWIWKRGMHAVDEFNIWHPVDLVGVAFGPRPNRRIPSVTQCTAVELKLHDVATVVWQSAQHRGHVNETFAAMPAGRIDRMKPETLDKFRNAEVGLLAVSTTVEVVIPSPWLDVPNYLSDDDAWLLAHFQNMQRRLWRRFSHFHPPAK